MHASKGLQWPAVIVPGLSGGAQSQVFPARPRVTTRWTENPRLLPFSLRGDAADLPALAGLAASDLAMFGEACAGRELAEERRLAYVAATRAAFWLACTGYWWGEGVSRLGPSAFLDEVRGVCQAGEGVVAVWAAEPEPDAANPALAEPATAPWPAEQRGHRPRARPSAPPPTWSNQAIAELDRRPRPAAVDARLRPPPGPHQEQLDAWARETELLLAERARRRGGGHAQVALPRQLPVSALVTMARDPAELARQVRRPMPRPPAPHALRGTDFHRWLEERFGQPQLIDADELPGAADDLDGAGPDAGAGQPQGSGSRPASGPAASPPRSRCRSRPWSATGSSGAASTPCSPTAPTAASTSSTGRPAGRRPPTPSGRAVAVQLAAYRLAWAGLARVPVASVRAAFYYVAADLTVRPADLLDEAGLAGLLAAVPAAEDPRDPRDPRDARPARPGSGVQVVSSASIFAWSAPVTPGRMSAFSVTLTRGARAATASTAALTTAITSSHSPSMVVNIASVWFGSPLSLTTRTASATYSATESPTPSGVTENATSIKPP